MISWYSNFIISSKAFLLSSSLFCFASNWYDMNLKVSNLFELFVVVVVITWRKNYRKTKTKNISTKNLIVFFSFFFFCGGEKAFWYLLRKDLLFRMIEKRFCAPQAWCNCNLIQCFTWSQWCFAFIFCKFIREFYVFCCNNKNFSFKYTIFSMWVT